MYKRTDLDKNVPLNMFEEIIINHTLMIFLGLIIIIAIGVLVYCVFEGFILNKKQITLIIILSIVILGVFGLYANHLHNQVEDYETFEKKLEESEGK
ncbi:hypothetical protein BUY22_02030 [Staphylococcus cohnii]|nr:hypothetical protein BUY22_02030 [Staphylococcus cohnii]